MEALLVERPAGWPVREAAWLAAALRDSASEALRPLLVDGLRWSRDVDSSRHVRLVALDSLRARGATPLAGLLKARLLLAADSALEEVVTLTAENQAVAPSLYFETGFMKLRALGRLGRWEEALIDAGRIRQRAVLYEDGAWLKDWEDRCRYFMTKSSDR
jgi:hypothetical protein